MSNYKNSNKTIGIIDSGLGGYTYYRFLRQHFPKVSFTFCADQAHVPYGNKSDVELLSYAINMVDWLVEHGAQAILIACNSLGVTVVDQLRNLYPAITFGNVVDFVLESIDDEILDLAVIGTLRTIDSKVYHNALNHNPERNIRCIATPWLAGAIEDQMDPELMKELITELKPAILSSRHLVLACTHYPIVDALLKEVLQVETIDGIEQVLTWMSSLNEHPEGASFVYTSGNSNQLEQQVASLFEEKIEVGYSDFKL